MPTYTIKTHSSDKQKTYDVVCTIDDKRMTITCRCPAGRWKAFCKHKWAVVKGNEYWLADEVVKYLLPKFI